MSTFMLTDDELHRYFEVFDEDGSGGISAEELSEAFYSLGWTDINPTHCEHMLKEQFGPATTEINFEQFKELVDDVRLPTDSVAECQNAFAYFDLSGVKKISPADLKVAGKIATGREVPDSLIRQIMQAVDTNKDGYIQFSEFRHAVAKVGIKEDLNNPFEKDATLGVGFGASKRNLSEQDELLALLESGFGEDDADYNDEEGVGLAEASMDFSAAAAGPTQATGPNSLANTTKSMANFGRSGVFGKSGVFGGNSKSMVFNGKTIRSSDFQSRYWSVTAHVTPSDRAERQQLVQKEWASRTKAENEEEHQFENDILTAHANLIEELEARIVAEGADKQRAEQERLANQIEAQRIKDLATAAEATSATTPAAPKTTLASKKAVAPIPTFASKRKTVAGGPATAPVPTTAARKRPTAAPTSNSLANSAILPSGSVSRSSSLLHPEGPNAEDEHALTRSVGPTKSSGPSLAPSPTRTSSSKAGSKVPSPERSAPAPTSATTKKVPSPAPLSAPKKKVAVPSGSKKDLDGPATSANTTTLAICKIPVTFTDGKISRANARKMLEAFGYAPDQLDEESYSYMFDEMTDKDGDGFIDVQEYKDLLGLLGEYEV